MSGGGSGSPGCFLKSYRFRRDLRDIKKDCLSILKSKSCSCDARTQTSKTNSEENKIPFEVNYEVEYLGDGDHCHLGEKYIISHTTKGMHFDKPLTLQQAKEISKERKGKVIKVSRTYI